MGTEVKVYEEMWTHAGIIAKSGFISQLKNQEQAMTLMLLCQAEGIHPMKAMERYDIVEGRPAKKSKIKQAEFLAKGGRIEFIKRDMDACHAKFSHKDYGSIEVNVTFEDICKTDIPWKRDVLLNRRTPDNIIGLKNNWKNHRRRMLHWRCVNEGTDALLPDTGLPATEEMLDENNDIGPEFQTAIVVEDKMPEDVDIGKDARKMRAELNHLLEALKEPDEFDAACVSFQKKHGGAVIWERSTCHAPKPTETLKTLAESHKDRIQKAIDNEKEWIESWPQEMKDCKNLDVFGNLQETYNKYEVLQTHDNVELMSGKGRELGHADYAEEKDSEPEYTFQDLLKSLSKCKTINHLENIRHQKADLIGLLGDHDYSTYKKLCSIIEDEANANAKAKK